MIVTVPLSPLADFFDQHPWPAIVLLLVVGVVLPAVWIPRRRDAALAVLILIAATTTALAAAVTTGLRGNRTR